MRKGTCDQLRQQLEGMLRPGVRCLFFPSAEYRLLIREVLQPPNPHSRQTFDHHKLRVFSFLLFLIFYPIIFVVFELLILKKKPPLVPKLHGLVGPCRQAFKAEKAILKQAAKEREDQLEMQIAALGLKMQDTARRLAEATQDQHYLRFPR